MAEKICVVCGEDCSKRPRTKDAQGRYVCNACVESTKKSSSGQNGAPSTEDALLAETIADAVKHMGDPCPSCGVILPSDAVLCTRCGLNLEKGKHIKTHIAVEKPKKQKKEK